MTEKNQEPNVEETKVQDVKAGETEEVQENAEVETVVTEQGEAAVKPKNKFVASLDNFFQISARRSNIRTEVVGGITTFFAMCYIMFVNPDQMTGFATGSQVWNSVYIGTGIGAIVGTLLMALLARMPYAQAPGMGLNSFFYVSFILGGSAIFASANTLEAQYQSGLAVIFIAGLLFLIISMTSIREKIAKAIPHSLKKAISAGIGLFIALIGMKNAGLIEFNAYTFVQLANFDIGSTQIAFDSGSLSVNFVEVTWVRIIPPLVCFLGLMIIGILKKTKLQRANVIIGIILATCLYYLFNIGNAAAYAPFESMQNPITAFEDWGQVGIGAPFLGFKYWSGANALSVILLVITFCLIDMFDTLGTLQGTATEAGLLDENGVPQKLKECLWCDSIATVVGGVAGTSTVTTFVESASGVSAGARTGFSSVIVAIFFFISLFLSPIAAIIPSSAISCALVYVGVLMLSNVKDIDFKDITMAIPAFLIIFMMPFTYSISNGIGVGLIAYTILKFFKVLLSGKDAIIEYYGVKTVELTEEEKAEREAKKKKPKDTKKVFGEFLAGDVIILVFAVLFALRFFLQYV